MRRTFVASSRPPSPASTTATSTVARRELGERGRRQIVSNWVASCASASGRTRATRRLEVGLVAVDRDPLGPRADVRRDGRADGEPLGEQERLDRPRRRRLAVRADDVDRRVGELRVAERREQRPHPAQPELLRPRAESDATQAVPSPSRFSAGRGHRARAGSARACRAPPRPPRASRSRRTSRSRASARRARPPCAAARSRPRRCRSTFARSGRTTASKIRFSSPSSSTRTPLRRKIAAASCTRVERVEVARVGRRPPPATATTIRRSLVELRPDLLGHVRHHRVQEREQALERGERGRGRVLVAVAEPRLDRLGVPVAEVVEGEPVERLHGVREVERGPAPARARPASRRGARGSSAPRARAAARPARRRCWSRSRETFQSLFASLRPSSSGPSAKRTSWVEDILSRP